MDRLLYTLDRIDASWIDAERRHHGSTQREECMPICPNGCGVNHRSGPTASNCTRYTTRNSAASAVGSSRAQRRKPENKTTTAKKRSSVAVNQDGSPMTLYHGSNTDFDSFDEEFTGRGNDTWGSGFYMTTSETTASGYGGTLKRVQLDIGNPYKVSGEKTTSGQLRALQCCGVSGDSEVSS